MKKIFMLLLCFFLFGCSHSKSIESLQFDEYHQIQESLIEQTVFTDEFDFDVYVVFNEINDEYRYDLIIDNPQNIMYDITAMCYIDEDTDDMFPSLGVFDEDMFHLKKGYINKEEGFYKGIQLSGMTLQKGKVKLYISYYDKEDKKIELFIEVNDEIR